MTSGPANPVGSPLAKPVTALWGVGAERAAQLGRLEIHSIEDLLLHRPRRYEDRQHFRPIADLQLHEPAITRGKVVALGVKRYRKGSRSVFELILSDGTGRLHCRWWNLPFMEKYFKVDDEVVVFGKPLNLKPRTIDHPEIEVVETGAENFIHLNRITPVYPLTEGLPQRWVRSLIWRTLEQYGKQVGKWESEKVKGEKAASRSLSHLPTFPLSSLSRAEVIRMLHFPDTLEDTELARQRLALEEFIDLQLRIRERRQKFEAKSRALPCGGDNRLIKPFLAALRFKLTGAQTKVLREIRADLRGEHPMRRLLQGDVGSGKTLVAACSALMSIESGFNVALMAPTEILAEQHFQNFSDWFGNLGVGVELRTGNRKESAKCEARGVRSEAGLRSSPASHSSHLAHLTSPLPPPTSHPSPLTSHLVIGTHALLSAGFDLPDLGLVIIDEQHRFGVAQREQLVRKGNYPHLLVMTATPIPRTLGLTLYGELDVSVIDELPAGRGRIKTFIRTEETLPKVWSFIRERLAEGRQVYVVHPRVEESGPGGLKAVTKEYENLKRLLAPFRAGLLHGRMRTTEKEEVMAAFRSNATQVLLTTSLIEVGVDVPNATIMLIENAGQFGLAQLHQLRGRIGRGAHDSYCILISSRDDSQERLKVLEETNDGFRIAEADLRLRGPGELLGQQQSGIPRFRFGDLVEDAELIRLARQWVNGLGCAR